MSYLDTAINAFLSIPGLRGFWPLGSFNEGGDAYDLSRHGHTLGFNNDLTYGVDPNQGAGYVEFGNPGWLNLADAANFDILGTETYVASGVKGLTLGGWFWFPSLTGIHQMLMKSDLINNCSYELTNVSSGSALFRFGVSGDGTSGARKFATMASGLSAGQWHFLVGRYTPSTEVAIFSDTTKAVNTTSIPASIFNSTSEFRIDGRVGDRAAFCFLSTEAISDALLDQLYEDSWPLFHTFIEAADTVTLGETVSRRLVSLVKPNQAVTLSEAATTSMTRLVGEAETVTLAEVRTVNVTRLVGEAETVTLSEAATLSMPRRTSAAETVTLAEAVTVSMVRLVSEAETVTLTEAQAVTRIGLVSAAETVTLAEAATVSMARRLSASETVTLTEGQAAGVSTAEVVKSETVTIAETVTVNLPRSVSASETVALSEALTGNLIGLVSAAETVTLAETVTKNLVSFVSTNQPVTLAETQTVSMARQISAAETVSLAEAQSVILAALVGSAETVTLSEAVTLSMTRLVSQNETVTLSEAVTVSMTRRITAALETVTLTETQSVIVADAATAAETITLSETGTTVVLISVVGKNETVTLSEAVTATLATFTVSVSETVTLGESVLVNTGTGRLVAVLETVTLSEAVNLELYEIVSIIVYDTLALSETFDAPLTSVTDTLTLTDTVVGTNIADTLTLTDTVTIGNVTLVIEDTLTFTESLELSGPAVPPPATAATSELGDGPVLRLLYGNDKRNPIRELDLAQLAPGEIRLMAGGFAPGAGERNELWSGESIRFDGQKKLAESLKNSELAVTYALKTGPLSAGSGHGSQAALSYFQRKVSRFFAEARLHQLRGQSHTVWLEYRWSDGLTGLTRPAFGQLSNYYEVYSATAPKWPDDLHDDIGSLTQGLIAGVVVNLTASPAPEGLRQRAALAAGSVSLHDKGVLIASGASSKLHWAGYTDSGLTGQFSITGWITTNAVWGSGTKYIFDYYVDASNRISIVYNATSNVWTITKIVGGSTFTTSSSTFAVSNGDDVHLQLVQDSTTLYLFVNGVQAASVAATPTMTDGGTIALGCPATGTIDGVDVILDGWRILPNDALTSTEALALYQAELPIKEDGGQVGPPPYFWTKDGDGQVDACDESARDNWGIIGGVGGDIEARTEIRLNYTDAVSKYYWLGIRTQDEQFVPLSYLWFEAGSTVVDATASEGSYQQNSGTAISITLSQINIDPDLLLGRYHWLTRLRSHLPATVTPGWFFTNSMPVNNRAVAISNTAFKVLSLGDTFILTDATPGAIGQVALRIAVAATLSVTFETDFALLLPEPFARITQPAHASVLTPSSTNALVIEDGHAHIYGTSGTRPSDRYEYAGDKLTTMPNKYNYLFLLRLNSSEDFVRTDVTDVSVYVTPRYLLPGGMVA